MTGKEKQEAVEMRYQRHCQVKGMCEYCGGGPYHVNSMQIAHIVGQGKRMLSKYGKQVIHHPDNWKLVCSLACNQKVAINVDTRRVEAEEHIKAIQAKIIK